MQVLICHNHAVLVDSLEEVVAEGLAQDLEDHLRTAPLADRFPIPKHFFQAQGRSKAEEALKVHVKHPEVAAGHHQEHPPIDFHTEIHRLYIDSQGGYVLHDVLLTSQANNDVFVFVMHPDAIFEDVDGKLDD